MYITQIRLASCLRSSPVLKSSTVRITSEAMKADVKRTTIIAVEYVSAVGRYMNSMIPWPAIIHQANWITYLTPGWHYTYFDIEYAVSSISLQWLKLVFDPQAKSRYPETSNTDI